MIRTKQKVKVNTPLKQFIMSDFVNINGIRIRKTTIKKYAPVNETKINIFYNTSRYKMDIETIDLITTTNREDKLEELDKTL